MSKSIENAQKVTINGKILKDLIKETGKTQNQFAMKIGINGTTLSAYIRVDNEPSLKNLVKIADELKVSVDYLLKRSDYKTANDKERAFAEKYNLAPDTLEGFMDTLNFIKEFSDSLDLPEVKTFIDAFLKTNIIPNLMTTAFLASLKKDAILVGEQQVLNETLKLNEHLENLDNNYISFCEVLFDETPLDPNKLIYGFSKDFSFCFSPKDKSKLSKATSITNLGDVLRNLDNETGKNFFIESLQYISDYTQGTLPEKLGEQAKYIVEEHFRKILYEKDNVK